MEALFWNTMRRVAEATSNNDTHHDGDDDIALGGGDGIHHDEGEGGNDHGDGHSEFGTGVFPFTVFGVVVSSSFLTLPL